MRDWGGDVLKKICRALPKFMTALRCFKLKGLRINVDAEAKVSSPSWMRLTLIPYMLGYKLSPFPVIVTRGQPNIHDVLCVF